MSLVFWFPKSHIMLIGMILKRAWKVSLRNFSLPSSIKTYNEFTTTTLNNNFYSNIYHLDKSF